MKVLVATQKPFAAVAVKGIKEILEGTGHEDLQDEFMAYAKECGMVGIKGHRSVGGFRASLYNACTQEDVDALVAVMQEFAKIHA